MKKILRTVAALLALAVAPAFGAECTIQAWNGAAAGKIMPAGAGINYGGMHASSAGAASSGEFAEVWLQPGWLKAVDKRLQQSLKKAAQSPLVFKASSGETLLFAFVGLPDELAADFGQPKGAVRVYIVAVAPDGATSNGYIGFCPTAKAVQSVFAR